MHYVLLIHAAESRFAGTGTPKGTVEATMRAYGAFTRELFATGRAGDCAALESTHTATSVRVREGRRTVTDGPFAETREQLGGYYTLRAESQEEALAWAAKIPGAKGGTIEVRPVRPKTGGAPSAPGATLDSAVHKQYVLLIYGAEAISAAMSDAERGAMYGRYVKFNQEIVAAGQWIAGEPLESVKQARSVSVVDSDRIVRDGPFAETREQLGGYFRVWARDLDEAIALAGRIPGAETGTIEVRPVRDTSAYA